MKLKDNLRQINTAALYRVADAYYITITVITPSQLRFTLEEHGTYDYYPVSGKISLVGSNKYEVINGIEDWVVDKHYNNKTK